MHQSRPHFDVSQISPTGSKLTSAKTSVSVRTRPRVSAAKNENSLFTRSPRINSLLGVQVIATGSYVPERVVTNEFLEQEHGFDPGWIEQRTGILERRHAAPHEATSDLSIQAARRVIQTARVDPNDIDLLVVGTFTPDHSCPSTACRVQDQLGLDAPAFDVQAACAGFMYALTTAAQFVATGNSQLALVVGADTNSRIVNPQDQRVAPLFGDGAGAVLLARGEPHQGLICYQTGADGRGGPLLEIPSSGTRNPVSLANCEAGLHKLNMDGRSVFKWAVKALTETIELMFEKAGLGPDDVALYLIHQANIRIINYAVEQLGLPAEKVFNNLHKYGNTSGGSVPIALDEAFHAGRISRGDTILMSGFGAGLTWGTALFRW